MDEREPLSEFRAYYTRERAAGSEEEAIKLSGQETGLYSMLRRAYYAGWEARAKVPPPPVEVPEAVRNALETLRTHFEVAAHPTPSFRAPAAGLGGGRDALDKLVEAMPASEGPLPPLPAPTMSPIGPPPVSHLADYRTADPPDGQRCPSCKSGDPDTRLPVWNEAFGEHTGCPDGWHPGNFTVMGAVTGRIKRVVSGLVADKEGE
jgi:hypothetical protein